MPHFLTKLTLRFAMPEHNGAYLQDCQAAPDEDLKRYAVDKTSAARLWKLSEELVGQNFDF